MVTNGSSTETTQETTNLTTLTSRPITTSETVTDANEKELLPWEYAVIAVGGAVLVLAVIVITICCCWKRRRRSPPQPPQPKAPNTETVYRDEVGNAYKLDKKGNRVYFDEPDASTDAIENRPPLPVPTEELRYYDEEQQDYDNDSKAARTDMSNHPSIKTKKPPALPVIGGIALPRVNPAFQPDEPVRAPPLAPRSPPNTHSPAVFQLPSAPRPPPAVRPKPPTKPKASLQTRQIDAQETIFEAVEPLPTSPVDRHLPPDQDYGGDYDAVEPSQDFGDVYLEADVHRDYGANYDDVTLDTAQIQEEDYGGDYEVVSSKFNTGKQPNIHPFPQTTIDEFNDDKVYQNEPVVNPKLKASNRYKNLPLTRGEQIQSEPSYLKRY